MCLRCMCVAVQIAVRVAVCDAVRVAVCNIGASASCVRSSAVCAQKVCVLQCVLHCV